jgi:hypothetical protein
MMWNETSKWAKSHGYKMSRKDGSILWSKLDDKEICGVENSIEETARAIFNHITNNKWVEHQRNYKPL